MGGCPVRFQTEMPPEWATPSRGSITQGSLNRGSAHRASSSKSFPITAVEHGIQEGLHGLTHGLNQVGKLAGVAADNVMPCSTMVLLLHRNTFAGEDGEKLAAEVLLAVEAKVKVVMIHDTASCQF